MKKLYFLCLITGLLLFFPGLAWSQARNLFNGKNLKGWHLDVPKRDTVRRSIKAPFLRVKAPFIVRKGNLVSLGSPEGHLISDSVYENYRLEVQYRFPKKPGNSGVLVHVSTPRALYKMFPRSLEVQLQHGNAGDFWCIAEDITVPDMERRRGPKKDWGTSENKQRRIVNLTDNSEKPVGEWNTVMIECINRSIKVWVNGDLVNYGYNCTASRGQIALQSEGSEVEFRKISITPVWN